MPENNKISPTISALCFLAYGIYCIIKILNKDNKLSFLNIFLIAIIIGLCIVVFSRKNNDVLVCISGLFVIYRVIILIRNPLFFNIMYFLSAVALFVITMLISVERLKNNAKIAASLWFLPAAFYLIFVITYYWFTSRKFGVNARGLFFYGYTSALTVISQIVLFVAFLFMGVWMKNVALCINGDAPTEKITVKPTPLNNSMPTLGTAEKLMKYKELLDSGIITQEEFNEKKKQLL